MRTHAQRSTRRLGGLLALLLATGCGRTNPEPATQPIAEAKVQMQTEQPRKNDVSETERARLHRSFKDAVLLEPPDETEKLLDVTATGMSVGKLFETVAGRDGRDGLWDKVRFVSPDGEIIRYRAVLTTDLGKIHVDLFPEAAPNHVRSFIALAQAGYYDGLPFYGSVRENDDENKTVLGYIEAGCPKGTGDVGFGSIGYWLRPETKGNNLTHEEGTVGAWHRQEVETAACRFYVATQKMPQLDGAFTIFGKVSRGLDIVRTINGRPIDTETSRLKEPVAIRKVVIETIQPEGRVASK